jgi:hypothetical protein
VFEDEDMAAFAMILYSNGAAAEFRAMMLSGSVPRSFSSAVLQGAGGN